MDLSRVHDISILHLFGEISLLEMERIEKTLQFLKKNREHKVLLDMSHVDHIHYTVIRRLVDEAKSFRQGCGDIKMAELNEDMKSVVQFSGADQFLEDYASISEAILSFLTPADRHGPSSH